MKQQARSRNASPLLCALLAGALGGVAASDRAFAETTSGPAELIVSADHLLDVRSGRMLDHPLVLVRDGRIVQVASGGGTLAASANAKHLDLPGLTLLPGLIDMHVHLDSDPAYGGYTELQFSDRFWSVLQVPHALATLEAGFTTVRNVGSDAWNDVGLREAITEGKIVGPRVVTAAYAFGATGGHCDSTFFPPGTILPFFAFNGLVDKDLVAKPALGSWDAIHSRRFKP